MSYISKFKTKNQGNVPIGSNLFGTCSTGSATATKVVSLSDFNVLTEGVTVHVYFTNENTALNPSMQVGSTASQPITGGGTWKAGRVVSFTNHSGSWVQNDYQDGSLYGLSYNDGVLELVENGGSQSVSIPDGDTTYTISISGHTVTLTGSDGSTSSVTIPDNNTTYTLTQDASNGHKITLTPSSGTAQTITIPDNNTTYTLSKSGNTIKLTGSDGSETSVTDANTTYSAMTQVQGEAGTSTTNMVISPKVLHDTIEALDDDTTYAISISGHTITLTPSEGTAQSVTVPDDDTTYTISLSGRVLTLTPSDGTPQSVTLPSSSLEYTEDAPDSASSTNNVVQNDVNGNVATGGYSLAEGSGTEASGQHSHAEGSGTVASGQHSHAEGFNTGASNNSSHAEGDSTLATGSYSHSEGVGTIASGSHSHAGGQGTEARGRAQTAIGEYNVVDTQNKYLFIIGNGTYPSPSNAFDVSWSGDLRMALATTEDLYTAINALGWASSPIIV